MRINFDRLSQLAGLPTDDNQGSLNESVSNESADLPFDPAALEEMSDDEEDEPKKEGDYSESMEEMIEVDEVMLVQELRRAKKFINENRKRKSQSQRKQNIVESELKKVIDEEVQKVMSELNLTSQWVYGERKPTRSRKGYTHQGSVLPGLGFKK
jgi:hypothetical protein